MANVLNNIIANQPMKPAKQTSLPSFTFDSQGKIKPLEDKAKLLPSRIFGSPIEYAKDLKQDIVNIGRAATGKANDHELGRINDVAMKLGSLGLAAYLFIKNPLKLSKAMEFVGFGTFFASMALWPKLAIQAPLKARTGVDIHQKYIDSQGRKKMVHQDPQYDLTDLYSREDLDKMGEKLKVYENLPERDNFIKQRAKKTAVQGNTLWMLTAGIATPTMSALACNRLEKPINKLIEIFDLKSSQRALNNGTTGFFAKIKQSLADRSFNKFIEQNADKVLDEKTIESISSFIGRNTNSASIQSAVASQISSIKQPVVINEAFITNALKGKISPDIITSLSPQQKALLENAMNEGSLKSIANILANAAGIKNTKPLVRTLELAKNSAEKPTVAQASETLKSLYSALGGLSKDKQILDRYVNARVGDKSGTYIANQWTRVCDKLLKSLKLNGKELKALSNGDINLLQKKLEALAGSDKYDDVISQLMKLIGDYENKTGETFISTVKDKAVAMSDDAAGALEAANFSELAKKLSSSSNRGTLRNVIDNNAKDRMKGAQSSFYRILQSLDLFKRIKNGSFEQQLKSAFVIQNLNKALSEVGKNTDTALIQQLTNALSEMGKNIDTASVQQLTKALSEMCKNTDDVSIQNLTQILSEIGKNSDIASVQQFTNAFSEIGKKTDTALIQKLTKALSETGKKTDDASIQKLTKACKNLVLNATTTDYIEKLKSAGFELTLDEYKAVMKVMFGTSNSTIEQSLARKAGAEQARTMIRGFNSYKDEFMSKVANWQNGMTPELARCTVNGSTNSANAIERNTLAAKPFKSLVQDAAKNMYNSQKWLKIFGGTMAALTAVTLIAGLAIGRKGKMEKQAEEESKKING